MGDGFEIALLGLPRVEGIEIVDPDDAGTCVEQGAGGVRADEARGTGDEDRVVRWSRGVCHGAILLGRRANFRLGQASLAATMSPRAERLHRSPNYFRKRPDAKNPKIKQGAIRDSAPLEEREIGVVYCDIGLFVAQIPTNLTQMPQKT